MRTADSAAKTTAATATRATSGPSAAVRAAMQVPGMPLEPPTRARFEAAFGCDLGHVRIHTDPLANAAARELDAIAFALGRDVFFAAGAYDPHSERGREVVAHELVHTLQHPERVDPARAALEVAPFDGAREHAAHAGVDAIEHGRTPAAAARTAPGRDPQIARLAAGLLSRRDTSDPAQVVVTVVETVLTALREDPDDRRGRVRRMLINLNERTRRLTFEQLEQRMASAEWHHLIELLKQDPPSGTQDGDGGSAEAAGTGPTEDETEPQAEAGSAQAVPAPGAEAEGEAADGERAAGPQTEVGAEGASDAPAAEAPAPEGAGAAGPRKPRLKLRGGKPRHPKGDGARAGRPGRRRPGAGGGASGGASLSGGGSASEGPAAEGPVEAEGPAAEEPAAAAAAPERTAGPDGEAAPPTEAGPVDEAVPAAGTEAAAPQAAQTEVESAAAGGPSADGLAEEAQAPASPEPAPHAAQAAGVAEAAPPPAVFAVPEPVPSPAAEAPVEAQETAEAAAPGPSAGEAPAGPPPLGQLPPENDDGSEAPSGGGGGGGAIPEPAEEPPAPAPSDAEPAAAMSAIAGEDPARMEVALGGVSAAVGRSISADRGALAEHPPEITPEQVARASGRDAGETAPSAAAAAAVPNAVAQASAPQAAEMAPVPVDGPMPEVPPARVTANADGQLTSEDAQRVSQAVDGLPTSDPALNVSVGAAPAVELSGAADPAQAVTQRHAVAEATRTAAETGHRDAAQPLGEQHIVPTEPMPTLRGEAPAAGGASGGGGAPAAEAGGATDPAAAIVAREKSGDTVRAAARDGAQQLTAKRQEQQDRQSEERASSQRAIDDEITTNAQEQTQARTEARAQVRTQRGDWNREQTELAATADREGDEAVGDARRETETQRTRGEEEARGHVDDGNRQIADARGDAEGKAREQKRKAEEEKNSGGFFSRVASAIGSFFDGIRDAIHAAFDAARKLVRDAIAAAQRLAAAAIDAARNAIVAAIRRAGDLLVAIGDRVLAGFPALRDRFRAAIRQLVDAAVDAVNRLADRLKAGVKALLDLLGRALTAILDAYEAIYLAAVNAVAQAVKGALDLAKGLIQALGVFAMLIRDVARNPGAWLRNMGAALMDGVRNHLWRELKAAVKEWFNSKVEAVVGVGKMILEVLRKGGVAFRRVAAMVWAAVKAAIPRAIIEFLIQRVISMLVPAAGAIMAIIEGLQAAWATVSRIVAAFERFVAFLRAVKDGNAGPLFARAVAAAAVAVIDFTANFIISKIGKAAKGVGGRLQAIAGRLMAWLRRGARAVGRGLARVGRAIVRGVRAVGRGLVRAGRWVANSRVGRYIRNSRVGRFVGRQYARGRQAVSNLRERYRQWRERRNSPEAKQARLDRAAAAIRPPLHAMLERGTSRVVLGARLMWWRVRYRLSALSYDGGQITARVNPETVLERAREVEIGEALLGAFDRVERAFESKLRAQPRSTALRGPDARELPTVAQGEKAIGGLRHRSDVSGTTGQMSYFEQMAALRKGNPAPSGPRGGAREQMSVVIAPSTSLRVRGEDRPSTMTIPYGAGADAYLRMDEGTRKGIVPRVEQAASTLGRPQSEVAGMLMLPRGEMEQALVPGGRESLTQERLRALKRIERVSWHYGVLEPARRPGIFSAQAIESGLAPAQGRTLEQVLAGGPMGHAGAASDPAAYSGQQRQAVLTAREDTSVKVYQIMNRLRSMVRGKKIVAATSGFNMTQLVNAVVDFLMAHVNDAKPDTVDKIGRDMAVELEIFLTRLNQR